MSQSEDLRVDFSSCIVISITPERNKKLIECHVSQSYVRHKTNMIQFRYICSQVALEQEKWTFTSVVYKYGENFKSYQVPTIILDALVLDMHFSFSFRLCWPNVNIPYPHPQ